MTHEPVAAWSAQITIPTYGIGQPQANPLFLEKRVYQGSSGAVYPYPVIEQVQDTSHDQLWTALFLENRYLKIMILPELGGRVQMALDKTNNYHFIYYNRVIKPALVGLNGPWIAGGIEFNWPQHHRPSTYMPVDWRIEKGADGSQTIWCAEVEAMFHLTGVHGFRLYPDRAYLEVDVRLSNSTDVPQTFLWWANPAVHVNEQFQSIFPPDVNAVMDHGKRAVSDFPIATGTYYKVDYAPGTDISRYKNIPVPTSYMAYHSDFDFIGCYDHQAQAGMIHVANHHLAPGKKQWTWGVSDFGRAWERQLTDEDGPYIELMCGAFTDNQPDFSWLMPGEEKRFTQCFFPFKTIANVKNANTDVVVNLTIEDTAALIGVYVTSPRTVRIELRHTNDLIWEQTVVLNPETAFEERVMITYTHAIMRRSGQSGRNILRHSDVTLHVYDATTGRRLIEFTPPTDGHAVPPVPAQPVPPPSEIVVNEELFLSGLHLEQYRHTSYAPEAYYTEALRRDPLDSRCNNAMGRLLYQRGQFAAAEGYFRRAIERLTYYNGNPYDGEPYYNLGLTLFMLGKEDEAQAAFYKATWNAAWQDAAWFELARLAARRGQLEEALALVAQALPRNWSHQRARHLKIALLRRLQRYEQATQEIAVALALNAMDYGAQWEAHLLARVSGDASALQELSTRSNPYLLLAFDYRHAGLLVEAIELLTLVQTRDRMASYYLAWCQLEAGEPRAVQQPLTAARCTAGFVEPRRAMPAASQAAFDDKSKPSTNLDPYILPNHLEAVLALQSAIAQNPNDAQAYYLLGAFWYARRQYDDAIAAWEASRALDHAFPTVHRNLGIAYFNQRHDLTAALRAYETAFALDITDARLFFELDQLYRRANVSPLERLNNLELHDNLVTQRDDLSVERIGLLNLLGRSDEALELLLNRTFHPWEGGEGKVTGQYVMALMEQAKRQIREGQFDHAIDYLHRAQTYPPNLGEGKLYGALENQIFYYLGCAHAKQGANAVAEQWYRRASVGLAEPTSALYYNDQPPEMIFYQGLALRKLGDATAAEAIFQQLVDYGQSHLDDRIQADYFAVSLPEFVVFAPDLQLRNRTHCHFMLGLGYLGLDMMTEATEEFDQVLLLCADHQGAAIHKRMVTQAFVEV